MTNNLIENVAGRHIEVLNVTLLEPARKHSLVFARFDGLQAGDTLTILNDHDPKPLYYQLLAERGRIFLWEYVEHGPVWWKVNITRNKETEHEQTLGEMAVADLRKAAVFQMYGLDFCCGGKKTLREACAEKGVDITKVERDLQAPAVAAAVRPLPYAEWGLDFLADYIVNTHHSYVKKVLPDLVAYAAKVASVHGTNHPELISINLLTGEVNAALLEHIAKEEKILFPYIRALVKVFPVNPDAVQPDGVQNPINVMEAEHELVGGNLEKIRMLSNNYTLPAGACGSYGLLFRMLEEFEKDLHLHVHLENNILFPKAIELENRSQNNLAVL